MTKHAQNSDRDKCTQEQIHICTHRFLPSVFILHVHFCSKKNGVSQGELEYYPYDKYKSPHTLSVGGGGYSRSQNSKCQDLPKFQFFQWGRGGTLEVTTQSAKICLNFNFLGGGTLEVKTQSVKICLNFNLCVGEGGRYSGSQNSKCQDLPKFQFVCGGGGQVLWKSKLKVPSSA